MDVSSACCSDLLQDIFGSLEEDVKQGTFSKPGGYYLYFQKKQELEKKYNQAPGKGIQAEKILKMYFESMHGVAETLIKRDQSLTLMQKATEVKHMKAEAAESANIELTEKQLMNARMMEQKVKSYRELMKQMNEKMKQEQEQLIAEKENVFLKLKEQELLLKEGFQEESMKLQQEMEDIKSSMSSPGTIV